MTKSSEPASPRLLEALAFAVERHGAVRQARKGTTFPYVIHPLRVGEILFTYGASEEVIVAGLLHDVTEDAGVKTEELEERFGERVAQLVSEASEPDRSLAWKTRKERSIEHVRHTKDRDALLVVAADKLDNLRSLRNTLAEEGAEETWQRFNAPEGEQRWYYRTIAEALVDREPGHTLFESIQLEVDQVFPPDGPRATRFFYAEELRTPEAVRPHLADPRKHWRKKRSAFELATSWIGAGNALPTTVRSVLNKCKVYRDCVLVEGLFEREVDLRTPGHRSQTDVLVLVGLQRGGYGVIAVEGKTDETFGEVVDRWNQTAGKQRRLEGLCTTLDLELVAAGSLRYQLLHRAASAVYEAQRYGASHALMLVHSFDLRAASLDDYQDFAAALGLGSAEANTITASRELEGVHLRLGWVKDQPH